MLDLRYEVTFADVKVDRVIGACRVEKRQRPEDTEDEKKKREIGLINFAFCSHRKMPVICS